MGGGTKVKKAFRRGVPKLSPAVDNFSFWRCWKPLKNFKTSKKSWEELYSPYDEVWFTHVALSSMALKTNLFLDVFATIWTPFNKAKYFQKGMTQKIIDIINQKRQIHQKTCYVMMTTDDHLSYFSMSYYMFILTKYFKKQVHLRHSGCSSYLNFFSASFLISKQKPTAKQLNKF